LVAQRAEDSHGSHTATAWLGRQEQMFGPTETKPAPEAHPAELLPQIRIVGRMRQLCPTSEHRDRLGQIRTKGKATWIKSSLIALGFAGAMVASTPAPAPAQGVHVGPGGVSVDVGRPRYREHYRGHHDYAYDRRHGSCRTVTIERAGNTHDQTLRLAGGRVCSTR
jgi:hypothetical protein